MGPASSSFLGATAHVLRPHRVARQTPHTLGRALGLLASAFALVNERNGEAGVSIGGLPGASPIPKQARDARGGGCGPLLGSPSEEVGHGRGAGSSSVAGLGRTKASWRRPATVRLTDPASSGDLAESAGLHVVDEAPHLILLGDEGAFLDALDGVADINL
jgi:hypothetical protein